MTIFDYSTLDAGIVNAVKWCHKHNFKTTDSGDGSKAETMECAMDIPMVCIATSKDTLIEEADRCLQLLEEDEFTVTDQEDEICLQAYYCPVQGASFISLLGKGLLEVK